MVHGVETVAQRLSDFKVTLAEVLKNAGYATAAFTGGYNVDARFGFDQGFDTYHGDKILYLTTYENRRYRQGVRLSGLLPKVTEWLSKRGEKPFFLFLHSWDTHTPYMSHEGYIERFSRDYKGSIDHVTIELATRLNQDSTGVSIDDENRIKALYDNEIRYVDEFVGQFVNTLKRMDIYEDTLIVLTSDHGDELLEHGMMTHAMSLYEPEIHVPLIVTYPKVVPQGVRVSRIVRTIDIFPTVLDVGRIEVSEQVEEQLQGEGLSGSWNGGQGGGVAFSQSSQAKQLCLRTGKYKYIYHAETEGASSREELYDLAEDPRETLNIAVEEPDVAAEMRARLENLIAGFSRLRGAGEAADAKIDDEFLRKLKSLGYMH